MISYVMEKELEALVKGENNPRLVAEGVGDCAQVIIFQLVCRSISMKEYSKIGEKKKTCPAI